MKRKLLILGGVVAAAAAAAGALLASLDVNQFRGRIQSELEKRLGRPVSLGAMGLGVFPLAIRADSVSIGETAEFPTGRPFATARQVRVKVGLWPLLKKEVHVESFVLEQPEIELVRDASGKWNFEKLGGSGQGGGGALELAAFDILNGALAVSTLGKPQSRSVYSPIDLSLRDFGTGKPSSAEARVQLPGPNGGSLGLNVTGSASGAGPSAYTGRLTAARATIPGLMRLAGVQPPARTEGSIDGAIDFKTSGARIEARAALDFAELQLSGSSVARPVRLTGELNGDTGTKLFQIPALTLTLGKLPLEAAGRIDGKASSIEATVKMARVALADLLVLARSAGGVDAGGTGVVSLNVRIQGPLDSPAWSGSGLLENASLSVPSLTKPVEVRAATLGFNRNAASLANLSAALGGSSVRGNVAVRNFSAPEVDFRLEADKLDMAEIQRFAAPSKAKSGGSPPALKARGTLQVGTLAYDNLVMNRVRADCAFSRGVLTLAPLSAEIFGGNQTGSLTLDTTRTPARLALDTKMERVDTERLLSATTSVKKVLYGLLAAGGNASMSLAPGAEGARSLNGDLNIRIQKGRLAGVNLLNEMASLAKFLGYSPRSEPFTDIVQLTGDVKMRDGVASTENLQLQIEGGSIRSTGTVNLADQTLNMRMTAVLDRATSQKAGGSKIGGFLTTALANPNGELVIPAIVSGTFAKPRFLPDGARVAEMKVKSLVPGLLSPASGGAHPAGGLLDLVDTIRGKSKKDAPK
jgi:hypothetical protein